MQEFDDPTDRCAHGHVIVLIDGEILLDENSNSNPHCCLSAAALHLLRTLDCDHTSEKNVGDCLVPAEGYDFGHHKGDPYVYIYNPMKAGRNWWVRHWDNSVQLETLTNHSVLIPFEEYKIQILSFADTVEAFFKDSLPKKLPDDEYDREGYLKFWAEWRMRRDKWNSPINT